jgi:hypothetical protein
MGARVVFLACCVSLFSSSALADASSPPGERTWDEKQAGGLSASRHSVATASVNVSLLPFSAAIWLGNASTQTTERWRRTSYAIGSATAAAAAANLGWLVVAGMSLSDYRQRNGEWMSVRRTRTHVGLTGMDIGFRLTNLIGGSIALSRGNGFGYALLIPNVLLLPFHVWALVASSRELRHRKRETLGSARRVRPIPSGFRF